MEFTHEQISEIISEITNGEQGLQGLGKQGFESLMLSERSLHNCSHQDVSNGLIGGCVTKLKHFPTIAHSTITITEDK